MSKEVTAEYFKDKSEEEIISWMLQNLSPEQIKTCLGSETPLKLDSSEPDKITVDDLRNFCANKRYIIHKIETVESVETVYFWYYLVKSGKWLYSNASIDKFPQVMGQNTDECGPDTTIEDDFKDDLMESYNNDEFAKKIDIDGESQDKVFNDVKDKYQELKINDDWLDILLQAINIQRQISIENPGLKDLFDFAPILIESVSQTSKTVNYYYLVNMDGQLKFVEGNIKIDTFKNDIIEIIGDLNLDIQTGSAGSSTSKTLGDYTQEIRDAVMEIDNSDLKRIATIYDTNPLSDKTTFFMGGLIKDIPEMSFGNSVSNSVSNYSEEMNGLNFSFGKLSKLKTSDIEKHNEKRFGKAFLKRYKPKKIKNKHGVTTVVYVRR